MAENETVRFAVIDFDEAAWRRDSIYVARKARTLGLAAAVEKSRSGQGAHVWFFLREPPVLAKRIRAVLTYVMTLVLEEHPEIGLDSYDRIIPNQDTLPKGGFGNLIALPLQAEPRTLDRSVFVDDDWVPYRDQWAYLSSVERIGQQLIEELMRKAYGEHRMLLPNVRKVTDSERPWEFFLPLWSVNSPTDANALFDRSCVVDVKVVLANRVYVEQKDLTPALRCRLIGLASFVNPEFYSRQRMKYSVYGEPRVISRALNGEEYLQLPRGCLESVLKELKSERMNPVLEDKRHAGVPIDVSFKGELRIEQKTAVADLQKMDMGILAAGTAFGKTVVATYIIAARRVIG